ncbi:MAG TPA: hypothetical protein VLS25_00355 [Dehalococcoidia bacterium]|nr:hypothetical protein [Dehalococcoidia bacterium]
MTVTNEEPLGLPKGTVRSVMSLGVLVVAAGLAAVLLLRDPGSDLTKVVIGGWIAALGNVIGFYFGSRTGA